ncbi:nucleotide sugar dehydrogenase [Planococcus sp. YIM B11945]|uniref:nucleotide sugar dehydrogenase n=1 Tax=Planococcus sp. YIM B11945 TaxID=3435410 RepID=UPI003D7D5A1C
MCVIGLGYIGLPTAAMFANNGWNVVGVDINTEAVKAINLGKIHIEEQGLEILVSNAVNKDNLIAKFEAEDADCFIIAVPTPHHADNTANLDFVVEAVKSIVQYVKKGDIIIIESTIPPRTINDVVAPIFSKEQWDVGNDIFLAHCPERVLPGKIIKELVENNRIIGGINNISTEKAAEVYESFVTGSILKTSALSAEMSKLMENTYRDVNIALANELVKISAELDLDALEVIKLANHHPRVNLHSPGPGVGGHCLAIDPYFIIEKAPNDSILISSARAINNSMPEFVVEQIKKLVPNKSAKISILGLTYKGNIDDVRESPAMDIIKLLQNIGYNIGFYDPHVKQEQVNFYLGSFEEAIIDSECLIVLTDHNEFISLDEHLILSKMKNKLIFDTKDCVNIVNSSINYINFSNLGSLAKKCRINSLL